MKRLIIGSSMKPALPSLSIQYFKEEETYKVNDIVIFWAKFLPFQVCHRIRSIDNEKFNTRGDNRKTTKFFERNVPIDHIEGKLIEELK
jgi:hypothetical protein